MADKVKKVPGPDHPIEISRNGNRVVVKAGGRVIADSRRVLTLREAAYPPVHYIPREDVDMSAFERTDHSTYCPYKGDASYFSAVIDGRQISANTVWSYEMPFEAVGEIKEHFAFYPDRVDSIEELAA
ncbi:DUF427 domain-containing protein [Neorhizobium alkalisoli]|uniref:Uncharacterized protein (DUF427 family) n=1 Tax=Neorhizobium alkalisoli TaxID=528178 RepID=A0A561QVU3_9HYPH|nr:DUF427 domain-containing protein [Neorhizobium alkalisoli]TWF54498.1 uncharacterized protein (DUF427 family) [Neorhizobium alkalisoli]